LAWDIFTTSVHEQNIPDVIKFSYLKSSVYGAASSISVTNDDYKLAIDMLKDKFGKRENTIEACILLQHHPLVMNQFNNKKPYVTMEKIL